MSLFFLFLFACFISCLYVAVITHREHNNHHDDHGNHWKRGCFSFPFPFAQSKGSSFWSFATILFVIAGCIGTGALAVAHKTQLQQLVAAIEIRRLIGVQKWGGVILSDCDMIIRISTHLSHKRYHPECDLLWHWMMIKYTHRLTDRRTDGRFLIKMREHI